MMSSLITFGKWWTFKRKVQIIINRILKRDVVWPSYGSTKGPNGDIITFELKRKDDIKRLKEVGCF